MLSTDRCPDEKHTNPSRGEASLELKQVSHRRCRST